MLKGKKKDEQRKNYNNYFFSISQYRNGDNIKNLFCSKQKLSRNKILVFSIAKTAFNNYVSIYLLLDLYKYRFFCEYNFNLIKKTFVIKSIPISSFSIRYQNSISKILIEHWKDFIDVYCSINESNIFETKSFIYKLIKRTLYSVISYVDSLEEKLKKMKDIFLLLNTNYSNLSKSLVKKQLSKNMIEKYLKENFFLITNYIEKIVLFINPKINNFNLSCDDYLYSISSDSIIKVVGEKSIKISLNIFDYSFCYKDSNIYYEINKKEDKLNILSGPNTIDFVISENRTIYKNYDYVEYNENKYCFGRYYNNYNIFDGCIMSNKENKIQYGTFKNGNLIGHKISSHRSNNKNEKSIDASLSVNEEGTVIAPYV